MFGFRSTRPARRLAIAMLAVATAIVAGQAAVAADSDTVLKIKPDQHDFGKVGVTHTSAPLTITVTNKSQSGPINFTSIVAGENFSIETDKCSGSPLLPGGSCKVQVVFRPTSIGPVSDPSALIFTDSASDSPQRVELHGEGIFGSLT
jgi:hypothetical protein